MASVVDWQKLGGRAASGGGNKGGRKDGKIEWVTLDKEVRIRPIGQAVEFTKIFVKTKNGNRSVIVDEEVAEQVAAKLTDKLGYDVKPQTRFAVNVIDRADGRVKVLENGMQIFGFFAKWQNTTEIHPGDTKQGYDWTIQVERTGPDPMNKKYSPIPIKPTPLTAEERALGLKKKEEYSLAEYYKSVPVDQVMDRIFGEGKGGSKVKEPAPNTEPQDSLDAAGATDEPELW